MENFVCSVNSHLTTRQENERLKGIMARIESYDVVVRQNLYLFCCCTTTKKKSVGEMFEWRFVFGGVSFVLPFILSFNCRHFMEIYFYWFLVFWNITPYIRHKPGMFTSSLTCWLLYTHTLGLFPYQEPLLEMVSDRNNKNNLLCSRDLKALGDTNKFSTLPDKFMTRNELWKSYYWFFSLVKHYISVH